MSDAADAPKFPTAVTVAGGLWVGLACVTLLGGLVYALHVLPLAAVRPLGVWNPFDLIPLATAALLMLARTTGGRRVLLGRADDTRWPSTASLVGGVVLLLAAAAMAWADVWALANAPRALDRLVVCSALLFASGVVHVAAGTLGLLGRRQYRAWRKHHGLPARTPRPHRYDDNEDNIDNSGPRNW